MCMARLKKKYLVKKKQSRQITGYGITDAEPLDKVQQMKKIKEKAGALLAYAKLMESVKKTKEKEEKERAKIIATESYKEMTGYGYTAK